MTMELIFTMPRPQLDSTTAVRQTTAARIHAQTYVGISYPSPKMGRALPSGPYWVWMLLMAEEARFRPIRVMPTPRTTGGKSLSISPLPKSLMIRASKR